MNKIITMIAGATLVGATLGGAVATSTIDPALDGGGETEISGTIRLTNGAWGTVSDAAHTPRGFGAVETLSNRIRVHYGFTHCGIESVQVTPDESFAAASVRTGVSVGNTYMDIFSYTPSGGSTAVDPTLLNRPGGNIWITGDFKDC